MNTFNTTMNCTHVQSSFFLIQNTCHFNVIPREVRRGARAKWVYNLVAREAHAQCVNRAWVLASCKVTAFIFTCIYPMVSAMTSYSSWRHSAFLFLGNIQLKAISNSHQWPKHSWRAVVSSSAKQCLLSANLKPFLVQTEQQTQERRIVNPRRGRFDTKKSSGAKNADLKFNGASNKDGWRW